MLKILLIPILFGTVYGQTIKYESINPSPTGFTLNSVAFSNSTNGVAVGDHIILRTADGGENWTQVAINESHHNITGIAFSDAKVGVAVGDSVLLTTIDGGLNWSEEPQARQNSGYATIAFSTHGLGLAIWPNGFLMQTQNGGRSWTKPTLITPIGRVKISFDNSDNCYLVDGSETIHNISSALRYVDLSSVASPFSSHGIGYYSLAFFNGNSGIAVGGKVQYASNANKAWIQATQLPKEIDGGFSEVAFSDSLHAIAVGWHGMVLRTEDAGKTWLMITKKIHGSMVRSVAFADDQIGITAGYDSVLYRTTDGGKHWATIHFSSELMDFEGAAFADANVGIAISDGQIYRTADAGKSWVFSDSTLEKIRLNSVAFTDSKVGIIAGGSGVLLRTVDGGLTWSQVADAPTEGSNSAVAFVNTKVGSMSGDFRGIMWRTEDAGLTWKKVSESLATNGVTGLGFANDKLGLAVGPGCTVILTKDGGLTWSQILGVPSSHLWLSSVAFSKDDAIITHKLFNKTQPKSPFHHYAKIVMAKKYGDKYDRSNRKKITQFYFEG